MLDRVVAGVASLVTRTEPPQIFTEVGRHPRLFRAWLPFAGTLLLHGALPRADAELVILRTAWNAGCAYEWEQHVELAARAGLRDEQIDAVRAGSTAELWTSHQRLLLEVVDQLHATRSVDTVTRAALETDLSPKQTVELCFLVGHYEMLAMLLNTRGVPPDRRTSPERRSDLGHWSASSTGRTLET